MAATWRCKRLEANLLKRQGRILRGTRARALKLDAGGVEIEVEQADGMKKLRAAAVVIADGGFQANLDMVRQSGISPAPEKLLAAERRHRRSATGCAWRSASARRRAAAWTISTATCTAATP